MIATANILEWRVMTVPRSELVEAWWREVGAARDAKRDGDARTHLSMLAAALRRRDRHEITGQLLRVVVAAPGSWTGRYPAGNTGGADVSAFAPMTVPDDLQRILSPPPGDDIRR